MSATESSRSSIESFTPNCTQACVSYSVVSCVPGCRTFLRVVCALPMLFLRCHGALFLLWLNSVRRKSSTAAVDLSAEPTLCKYFGELHTVLRCRTLKSSVLVVIYALFCCMQHQVRVWGTKRLTPKLLIEHTFWKWCILSVMTRSLCHCTVICLQLYYSFHERFVVYIGLLLFITWRAAL